MSTLLQAEVNGFLDSLGQFLNTNVAISIDIKHLEDINDVLITDDKIVNIAETSVEL